MREGFYAALCPLLITTLFNLPRPGYSGMRVHDVVSIVNSLKKGLASEPGPLEQRRSRVLFDSWIKGARERERARTRPKQRRGRGPGEKENEDSEVEVLELELVQLEEKYHRDNLMVILPGLS